MTSTAVPVGACRRRPRHPRQVIDRAAVARRGGVDFVRHHALREQRIEGLPSRFRQVAGLDHRPGEEARIEQVQDRVLDAADILVDIHPVIGVRAHGRGRGVGAVKRA